MGIWEDEIPAAKEPAPEPPVTDALPVAPWDEIVGSPEYPVKTGNGTWSAGGHIKQTLCKSCSHLLVDGTCSGPPNEAWRADPTRFSCSGYRRR